MGCPAFSGPAPRCFRLVERGNGDSSAPALIGQRLAQITPRSLSGALWGKRCSGAGGGRGGLPPPSPVGPCGVGGALCGAARGRACGALSMGAVPAWATPVPPPHPRAWAHPTAPGRTAPQRPRGATSPSPSAAFVALLQPLMPQQVATPPWCPLHAPPAGAQMPSAFCARPGPCETTRSSSPRADKWAQPIAMGHPAAGQSLTLGLRQGGGSLGRPGGERGLC